MQSLASKLIDSFTYPLPAFHFRVSVGPIPSPVDMSFQEVSGIQAGFETEEVQEAGENQFTWQLPTGLKQKPLTLKRGVMSIPSPLMVWCASVLESGLAKPIKTKTVWVFLLNEMGIPVMTWSFANAYPVRWEVGSFSSTKNEVAVETIEMCYTVCSKVV